MRLLILALLGLLSGPALAQVSTLYVDARAGSDVTGTGSAAAPFRTLSKAATQRVSLPVVFRLRRGTYDEALGESFPIQLPSDARVEADPATVTPGSFVVRMSSTLGLAAMFKSPSGSAKWSFQHLSFGGGQFRAIQMLASGARDLLALTVEDCQFLTSRSIALVLSGGSRAVVVVARSRLQGVDVPFKVDVKGGSNLIASFERSEVYGGLAAGLALECNNSGRIDLTARNTAFWRQMRACVLVVGSGGIVNCDYEHCTFAEVGKTVIGGNPAALVEGGGNQTKIRCSNSLFWGNKSDVASYSTRVHSFQTCLVEQASLQGIGGNVLGSAQFVVPPSSLGPGRPDWHLLPGSPGVDAATKSALAEDLHGTPRNSSFARTPPDIGAAELHDRAIWVVNEGTGGGGGTLSFRSLAQPSVPVVLHLGTQGSSLPFVPAPHIGGLILPFSAGVCDAGGLFEQVVRVQSQLLPLGLELWFQPVFLQGALLGPNAARYVVRAK